MLYSLDFFLLAKCTKKLFDICLLSIGTFNICYVSFYLYLITLLYLVDAHVEIDIPVF